ncbi:MAG: DUF4198 domain-containing protein [Burkholderiales bacterium]
MTVRSTRHGSFAIRATMTFATALGIAMATQAHETWILPAKGGMEKPGNATLLVTSGISFPQPETAVDPKSVSRSGLCIRDQKCHELEPFNIFGPALALRANVDRPGSATAWLELSPHEIELTQAQIEAYFDEIHADQALRDAWAAEQPKAWRERYVKFAKTVIRVGAPDPTDVAWSKPIGGALEIVPENNPTLLGPGDTLTVRVLKQGVPLPRLMLAMQVDGGRDWQRTDVDGRARFKLKGRGPWLIHGTELLRTYGEGIDWESWFTTLTIAPNF